MKRNLVAVAVMFTFALFLGEVLPIPAKVGWWVAPAAAAFVGAFVGGLIARRRFVPKALLVHAFVWALGLLSLYLAGNGPSSYAVISLWNLGGMAVSFPLAAFGAWAGQKVVNRQVQRPSAANA